LSRDGTAKPRLPFLSKKRAALIVTKLLVSIVESKGEVHLLG
jgi:hypothetical protein